MSTAAELLLLITAKDMATDVLGKVGSGLGGLGAAGKLAAAGLAGIATAGVGLATAMIGFAEGAANATDGIRKLARETGLTAEEVSKLSYAGSRLNVDTDMLSRAFGVFSKNIETNQKMLKAYSVETAHNADGTVDLESTIDRLANKFIAMPDGVEKTNLALQLFGKSGKDMIPFLNEGSHGLANLGSEAKKMGLVFSRDAVDAAYKFEQAQKDLSDRLEGFKDKIGIAVLPILTSFLGMMADVGERVLPPVAEALGKVTAIAGELFGVISGQAPDAGAALTAALGEGPAKLIMQALALIRDTFKAVFTGDIAGVLAGFQTRIPQILGAVLDFAKAALPKIGDQLLEWGREFFRWVVPAIPPMLKELLGLLTTGIQWLGDHADQIGDALVEWGGKFGEFIFTVAIPALLENIPGILLTIEEWVRTKALPGALVIFGRLGMKIIDGIVAGLGELKTMVGNAIGSALRAAIDSIDFWVGPFHVTGAGGVQFSMPSFGSSGPPPPGGGNYNGPALVVPGFASGFDGIVTKPTLFMAGEAGPERLKVTPQSAGGYGGGEQPIVIHLTTQLDGETVANNTFEYFRRRARLAGGVGAIVVS